jgi:GDPmannose 4,6-dehydratase
MTAIIFGAKGQDGIYLTTLLKEKGFEVIGIDRNNCASVVNISNLEEVCNLVKQYLPVYIFHFAANSTTRHEAWEENHVTISTGSLNILEAVKLYSTQTKIFFSGSGLQFVNEGKPITETDEFAATSMYAVSRIHTAYAARYYRSIGIKIYIGYFFNHDSPYRTERHINKKIIETVKRIAKSSTEKLVIGDLKVKKEFGYAGDIVKGVLILVEQDTVFEAAIGTGKAHTIEEWVDICFALYGLNWQQHVETIPGFKSEYEVLVSNPTTIFSLGWGPETDIHSLAVKMNEL